MLPIVFLDSRVSVQRSHAPPWRTDDPCPVRGATGESVVRDMFYDGNPRPEPGAIVCRVAPSFTRFGNFEILASRQDIDLLRKLLDYTLAVDFPELGAQLKCSSVIISGKDDRR